MMRQRVVQQGPNTIITFSRRDCAGFPFALCTLCSISWMVSGFYFMLHCTMFIQHHMLCYLNIYIYIYNYITFTTSLEGVYNLSFPPGSSGLIISEGDYADNSFAALGSSDPREVRLEL